MSDSPAVIIYGSDGMGGYQEKGTNHPLVVDGYGIAGIPAGGVVSVQGVSSGQAMPISGSITATQATGTNLHTVVDSGSITATQATGTNLHAVVDSGSITVTQATATNLNATVVQGTGTNLHAVVDSGSITAVQATGTNLHTVVDSGSITATQATGTNLHTVVDSGAVTVSQATAANLNATVVQATGTNLHTVVDSGTISLPSGAATSALQTSGNSSLSSVDTKTPVLGQAVMASSSPVVIASDQASISTKLNSSTATLTNVAGSASSVTLLASNANRLGATIVNDSTAILYVKFGTTASSTSYTVRMTLNAYYEVPFGYTGRIDGIWTVAAGNARITELT